MRIMLACHVEDIGLKHGENAYIPAKEEVPVLGINPNRMLMCLGIKFQ